MAVRIVFVGKSKAGKTWAADYIRREYNFKKIAFNDGLLEILRKLYYYESHQRIKWETRLRYYDAFYKVDPNVWAGYLERRLRTTTRDVVVDDPRYLNEVAVLKGLGFVVIRLVAPEARRSRRLKAFKSAADGLVAVHDLYNRDFDSTVGVDFSIYNDTKESTRLALDGIVERLRKLDIQATESA